MRLFPLTAVALIVSGPVLAADMVEPVPAEAPIVEAAPSWYIAARVGAAFPEDTDFGVLGTTVTNEYNTGFVGGLAVGTQFNLGGLTPRGELEVGYMSSGIDAHTIAGVGTVTGDDAFGDTNVIYGLANVYLDLGSGPLKPFIGGGIGIGHVDFDGHGVTGVGTAMDDSGTGFAWQIGGGVSYAFNDQLTAEVGYRYFNVDGVNLTAVDGTESDVDVRAHQVMVGLRYAF
jgi:opacity protein-like surface antigen